MIYLIQEYSDKGIQNKEKTDEKGTQNKEDTEDKAVQSQEEDPFAEDEEPMSQSILASGQRSKRELFQKKEEITVHKTTRAQILKDFDEESVNLVIESGSSDDDDILPVTQLPGQKTPPR